jgi:Tfp pilus assembly protein PilE
MVELNKKIQASTLIEVLIALTIISISVGISMMIHTNVMYSNRNSMKMKAVLLMNEISIETLKTKNFYDEEINSDIMVITKKIEPFKHIEFLYEMSMEARDKQGIKLAERKELVLDYDNSNE